MKKQTQTQVVERMLLNKEVVTGSTAYAATKKHCKVGSLNLHVLLRPLKEKYNIVGEWKTDDKGNRFKSWTLKKSKK
jgi:hypothetical protein